MMFRYFQQAASNFGRSAGPALAASDEFRVRGSFAMWSMEA
jgi:hypothetical protein